MSCRLWVMLIFIIFPVKYKIMGFNYIENCFYEKRFNTALHGYNDLHDRWMSDFDCFTRCLKTDPEKCRSFEHWHQNRRGLCVRANISSTDYPAVIGHNQFVNYYEIDCRNDAQVVEPSTVHCPDHQLILTVKLNGLNPKNLFLGDHHCKANWSNETHAQFVTHIDNCSLILTNGSIIGKLRWDSASKESNSIKKYERFVTCASNIYQIRYNHRTTTTANSRNLFSMLPNHPHDDEPEINSAYRLTLEWSLHNRSYFCPKSCFISLYSLINITLSDSALISSKFFIDSCDLIALPPYTNYLQSRRLISQGCSIDPTVIHVPKSSSSPLSIFHFSFYLYHILKEPIPFEIQCKILQLNEQIKAPLNIDCSSINTQPSSKNPNDKRDYSYTLFRSLSIYVARQIPLMEHGENRFSKQNSTISIATVHYPTCSFSAFFVLILYII